jgi:sugar/nucleoside kinase (ribokinase family)
MAARLTRHYGTVVLKLGGEGCVLAVPGQAPVRVPAHPARATDTTGAGDAFCGAFLSRWLSGGPHPDLAPTPAPTSTRDLAAAAEFAVRIAATVVTRFGARPVQAFPRAD